MEGLIHDGNEYNEIDMTFQDTAPSGKSSDEEISMPNKCTLYFATYVAKSPSFGCQCHHLLTSGSDWCLVGFHPQRGTQMPRIPHFTM